MPRAADEGAVGRAAHGLPGRPTAVLVALGLAVTLLHLWLGGHALADRLGEGAADTRPRRIDVAFVRELVAAAPPPVAPLPAAVRAPRPAAVAAPPKPAASAPPIEAPPTEIPVELPLPTPVQVPVEVAQAPVDPVPVTEALPAPPSPLASAASAVAPKAAAASAPAAPFEWPPSTRLSYRLTGNYRGPVEGQASVEWLRSGTRYQVHMEVSVGPSFAPLMSRRITSDGEVTDQGLRPSRYDEETRALLRATRRQTIVLDPDLVRLPAGTALPRPSGVQDSASQFVQLTWLFTTQPQLLQVGRSVSLPLALPRRIDTWTYDVLGRETLNTPAGPVDTVHVKPRRELRPGGDLVAEMWIAPSLQYLPVRIVIRQDAETFIDMLIERLPQQAEPGR